MSDWTALEDAKISYSSHADNLLEMADDWGRRAIDHYNTFYLNAPARVKTLAGANDANILVQGVFAGWDGKGQPNLIFVRIVLNQTALPPIVGTRYVFPPQAKSGKERARPDAKVFCALTSWQGTSSPPQAGPSTAHCD